MEHEVRAVTEVDATDRRPVVFVRITSAVALLLLGVSVAAGCGSSKPEYCSKVDELGQAVDTLKTDASRANFSAVRSDLSTVDDDLDAAASSAKSDFPSETSAVRSSTSTLTSAIKALPPSPSAADFAQLGVDIKAVTDAVDSFKTATSSKCD
jgi:hypothetical protein